MEIFETGVKEEPWTPEEDKKNFGFALKLDRANWLDVPKPAGIYRPKKLISPATQKKFSRRTDNKEIKNFNRYDELPIREESQESRWSGTSCVGNKTIFESIKAAEGAALSFQEIEEITPNSEVESFRSSTLHPNSNQGPLQTTETTMMQNSAQALKYDDARSDNSESSWVSAWENGVKVLYVRNCGELLKWQVFKSKEALIQWTKEFGRQKGFEIMIKRSDLGIGGPKPRITFCCERGGKYRNIEKIKEGKNISTKRCEYPFTLKGHKLTSDDNWILKVVCGVHNHLITKPLEGRSYTGRLSKEETSLLIDMSKSKARPKDILGTLKNRDANNVSTIKHVYNVRQRYKLMEMAEKSKKLTEIGNSQSTSLMEPKAKKELRGLPNSIGLLMMPIAQSKKNGQSEEEVYRNKRLKSHKFVSSFPTGLQPYIHDIKDVVADGNCGFRAIADLMGFEENGWLQVRKDLLKELISREEDYRLLYGTFERVNELIHALSYFDNCPNFDHWMTMPDMGHLIASAYNVVLFHLSSQQCLTFLPLRSTPMPSDSHKAIAIGFVNSNHFIEVFLLPDHPVPPITSNWYKFHDPCAEEWDTVYISRIEHFRRIIGNDVVTDEIIIDSNSND